LVILVVALAGCGYRWAESGSAATRAVWLGPVDDRTQQPLFGARLRAALAREVVDRGDASLSPRSRSGALLTVQAASLTETATAFVVGDVPRQYSLQAEVEARLTGPEGQILWKGLGIKADRLFPAGDVVEVTQANKEIALDLLAGDLSREILRRASLALEARRE
jgi:hypothetical protein